MDVQVCNVCGVEKPITDFPKNGTYPDGSPRRRPDCTVCYNIKRKLDKKKHNKFVNNTMHRTGEIAEYSIEQWREALVFFGGCCAYCGRPQSRRIKLTKDHIKPVSQGGKTTKGNIIPACTRCNSSKSNQNIDDWYPKQPFYNKARMEAIYKWRIKKSTVLT
jgi:5-methylcytosine-specific restriction endonuclease McrA